MVFLTIQETKLFKNYFYIQFTDKVSNASGFYTWEKLRALARNFIIIARNIRNFFALVFQFFDNIQFKPYDTQ